MNHFITQPTDFRQLPPKKIAEFLFWTAAVLMLFLNLHIGGLRGSEGRWAEVVRTMFLTGDFLHPMINFEPYFDKPLFSYWTIAAGSVFCGGIVTELLIRIPSALAGLVTLWAARLIAIRFEGKTTGFFAGWILLTVYSFAFWGRLGEADMLNLAFGTLAVGWYVLNREKNSFSAYLIFGLLCAVGGQTKGLSAIAVPVLAVLADLALSRGWKKHLNWKICAAGIISVGVYLTPFLVAALKEDYSDNGLALVFQENIQRFFNSLDHKQPWYAYFIHLPQLFLPWTPFLILALIAGIRRWKNSEENDRWVLVSIGLIFSVFSLSDSKRVYYILPILPFCAILTARFMLSEGNGTLEKIRNILLKIYVWMIPVLALLLLAAAGTSWICGSRVLKKPLPPELMNLLPALLLLSALILAVIWLVFRRMLPTPLFPNGAAGKDFALSAACSAVILIVFFGILMPQVSENLRTEKRFFAKISQYLDTGNFPSDRVFFFYHGYTNPSFYLSRARKVIVLDREREDAEPGRELQKILGDPQKRPLMVIGQLRYFRKIQSPALRKQVLDHLKWTEESGPLENPKKNGKKYAVLLLD
ncbi:MAG: glycosyltransferase family 39 protein [Lentisphaeria bacterium]|nr:glycosyltransferase family 39 protein [Lentisphaeria bacterium]